MSGVLKEFKVPSGFLVLGIVFLLIGFNGQRLAVNFSRPGNAGYWETSQEMINGFTYFPIIVGVVMLLLFVSTFSIVYAQSFKKTV
ncbi:hypothetical protein [Jeotgalibacillus sp. R-1-5s-1]|uniref:hypothetical protein n=1 Tax=Jeotgalibacillus sp. R-1-5s-1 TaxID=2555897 RepID=UPI00106A63AE|nr:hypothetical protein [Jeotgalibacillus sp. R-1-5s-1]TFD94483.1 hypothetical protein E2491_13700 [Jeotgalibacillus sp. R-1-5s-1]